MLTFQVGFGHVSFDQHSGMRGLEFLQFADQLFGMAFVTGYFNLLLGYFLLQFFTTFLMIRYLLIRKEKKFPTIFLLFSFENQLTKQLTDSNFKIFVLLDIFSFCNFIAFSWLMHKSPFNRSHSFILLLY